MAIIYVLSLCHLQPLSESHDHIVVCSLDIALEKTQLFLFHPKYGGNCFYTLLSIETCFFSADTNCPGSPPILPPSDVSEVNRIP